MDIEKKDRRSELRRQRRQEERDWHIKSRRRTSWGGAFFGADDLLPYFPDCLVADVVRDAVDEILQSIFGAGVIPEFGVRIVVRVISPQPGSRRTHMVLCGRQNCEDGEESHLAILGVLDDESAVHLTLASLPVYASEADRAAHILDSATSELRIPFSFILRSPVIKNPFENHWLYNLSFKTATRSIQTDADDALCAATACGYTGVSKKTVIQSLSKHSKLMRSGQGGLLQDAWRALSERQILHYGIAVLTGWSKDESPIRAMEAEAIAAQTRSPFGLNAADDL